VAKDAWIGIRCEHSLHEDFALSAKLNRHSLSEAGRAAVLAYIDATHDRYDESRGAEPGSRKAPDEEAHVAGAT
jgi:hypothetical protein